MLHTAALAAMIRILASIALRSACCAVVAALLWRAMGLVGLVVSAPLAGVLLARPLLDLASELHASARQLAFGAIEGRHFEHRGIRLDVVEDPWHRRWIRIRDVQKLIPSLPRPAVLRARFPDGVHDDPAAPPPRIDADALLQLLADATAADSLRFRNWLEREVVLPGAKLRQRLGIRDPLPLATDSSRPVPDHSA